MGKRFRSFYHRITPVLESRYFLPACLVAAFATRLLWVVLIHNTQVSDCFLYERWGREIAEGKGYTISGRPTFYYPIGYPAFLGFIFYLFGFSEFLAKLVNVFLQTGNIALSYGLAQELVRSRRVAALTAFSLAIHPNQIAYSSILINEHLFTLLMLVGILLLVRSRRRLWAAPPAGVALGLANTVRPVAVAILLASLGAYLVASYRRKLLSRYALMGALAVFGFGVGVLPLAIRNYLAFHRLAVTSLNGGINLLLGNNPYANGMYPNDAATVAKAVALVKRSPDEFEYNRNLIAYAKSYIANHPLRTIMLWWRKIFYLYAFEVDGINRTIDGMRSGGRLGPLKVITQGYYTLLMLCFLASLLLHCASSISRKGRFRVPGIALWLLAAWTAVHMITFGASRFHYPMIPLLFMCGAVWVHFVGTRRSVELVDD